LNINGDKYPLLLIQRRRKAQAMPHKPRYCRQKTQKAQKILATDKQVCGANILLQRTQRAQSTNI
jgi:hypothetical protein